MSLFGGDCNCHLLKKINQDLIPHETLVTLPIIKPPRGVRHMSAHMPKGLSANKRRGRTRQNVQDKGPEQSPEEIWKLAVVY